MLEDRISTIRRASLMLGVATVALLAARPAGAQSGTPTQPARPADGSPGAAETVPPGDAAANKEIVVTGSSIRGVPPTGSSLIQLGAEDVVTTGAGTTQELLANVPQLSTFNTAPTAGQRSNSSQTTAPNIRGIGQGATLSLVNGHRIVAVGALQNLPDPSFVPPSAIQRVEVIADGASATYGSDAVAGVVNVITRRDYEGLLSSFRIGYGDDYRTLNTNTITGSKWDGGGVIASVEYNKSSRLRASDRNYLTQDFSALGGQDQRANGTSCDQATYRVGGAGNFIQPATGAVNPRCINYQYGDLYPKQYRLSFYGAGHQTVVPDVEVGFDAFHSATRSEAAAAPIYTTGVMTRANPFFPTGVAANVNSITAYYSPFFLAPGGIDAVKDRSYVRTYGGTLTSDVTLGRFKWSSYLTGSRNKTDIHEANFNSTLSSQLINSNTAATAIDPFGGRTSESTRIGLNDFENRFRASQAMWEFNSKIDGALFALPAGDLKVAVGGNYRYESYNGLFASGRIGFNEGAQFGIGNRNVSSGFIELFVPVFGDANGMTLLRALDISLAGRLDRYSDFGTTKNPKVGVRWSPVSGLSIRGSYGKSFHAPALNDLYAPDTRAGYLTTGTVPPGFDPATNPVPGGIFIAGGDPNLGPERARNWSLGFDLTPDWLRGFRLGLTYYNLLFKDRISTPSRTFYSDPNFRRFIVDNFQCDGGATYNPANPTAGNCRPIPLPAGQVWDLIKDISRVSFPAPVNGPSDLPPIYNVTLLRRANLSFIKTDGLDFDISYRWSMVGFTWNAGVQGNYVLRYDQAAITGAALVDQFPFGQARLRARGTVAARQGGLNLSVNVNYSGKYRQQYTLANTLLATESIDPFTTVDTFIGYQLPDRGVLSGVELTLNVDNLFDEAPPFRRAATGYGNGNVLGRVVSFGVRKKF